MSRKNASYMWDDGPDSPEELAKNMAEIDAIIFNGSTPKPKKKKEKKESEDSETGFSNDLLSSILERNGVEDIDVEVDETDDEDMTTDVVRKDKPEIKIEDEDVSIQDSSDDDDEDEEIDAVTFLYMSDLRRIIIDDGIAPTSYAIDETDWTDRDLEDNAENWTEEDYNDISGAILDCLVTFAYPTAIIDVDEVDNYLEKGLFNTEEFQLYRDDEYIFCYRINGYGEFRDALTKDFGRKKTLQILRNLVYKASNPHEGFDANNTGAVALYANMFDDDDKESFAEIFNENTIEALDTKFHIHNIIRSQEECREMLEEEDEEDSEDDPEMKNEVLPDTEEEDELSKEEEEELEDSIEEYQEDTEDDISAAIDGITDLDDTEDDDEEEDADDDFSDLADSDDLVVDVVRKN